jgi:DNA-binding CsgD family transcriptional regulator
MTEQQVAALDELKQLDADRAAAERIAIAATTRRNAAVLELIGSGIRQAQIARTLGVSPGRVSQIVAAAERSARRTSPDPRAAARAA